jgi:pSer/pThr/pTyr-binding forkhead associated (FHA) protein
MMHFMMQDLLSGLFRSGWKSAFFRGGSLVRDEKSTQRLRRLRRIQAQKVPSLSSTSDRVDLMGSQSEFLEMDPQSQRLFVECGGRSATTLRFLFADAPPVTVVMDRPNFLIGSAPNCDLVLSHAEIHPHHALLQWVNGSLFYCDLTSSTSNGSTSNGSTSNGSTSNGSTSNGSTSDGPTSHGGTRPQSAEGVWVRHEPVCVGPYQLLVQADETSPPPEDSPLVRSPRLANELPQIALQFQGVAQSENQWPVDRILTVIGRGSQCRLRLNHESIPQVLSCLLRTPTSCWIIDIAGAGTTTVNGRPVTISPIDIGDNLQLGTFSVDVIANAFPQTQIVNSPKSDPESDSDSGNDSAPMSGEGELHSNLPGCRPPSSRLRLQWNRSGMIPAKSHQIPDASHVAEPGTGTEAETEIPWNHQAAVTNRERPDSGLNDSEPVWSWLTDELAKPLSQSVNHSSPSAEIDPGLTKPHTSHELSQRELQKRDLPQAVVELLRSQQAQLDVLKSQIDQIRVSIEKAPRRLTSGHMQNLLERSISETLQTHHSMSLSLAKLIELISIE